MLQRFVGKRFFTAIASVLTVVLVNVGLPEEAATRITEALVIIAGAYFGGQSLSDAAGALRKG